MSFLLPKLVGARTRPPDGSPAVVDGLVAEIGYYDRRFAADGIVAEVAFTELVKMQLDAAVLEVAYEDRRIFLDGVTLEVGYT